MARMTCRSTKDAQVGMGLRDGFFTVDQRESNHVIVTDFVRTVDAGDAALNAA